MKIQFNHRVIVGDETFEPGDQIEIDAVRGNEFVCNGVAGVVEHDLPKRRDPRSVMKKEAKTK